MAFNARWRPRAQVRHALSVLLIGVVTPTLPAAPTIYWSGDPVAPGETALLMGADFGDAPRLELARLPDHPPRGPGREAAWPDRWQPLEVLQPADTALKFVVPQGLRPGVFAFRLTGTHGSSMGLLNRPAIWWAQGDLGLNASPGGWVRIFGKNLASQVGEAPSTLILRGPRSVSVQPEGDEYALQAALPPDLPAGEYEVFAHNGHGGDTAWSLPVTITVSAPSPWPQTVFNVRELGAAGDGRRDDTEAVQTALRRAKQAGGGVVYFPRGRYLLSDTLDVPVRTVLRGESQQLTQLFWGDGADGWKRTVTDRLPCVIRGTHDFGVEDLMMWFVNANNGLWSDQKGDLAGNVFVRRVRMQWLLYGGYITIADANEIFRETALDGGAGAKGTLLRLGGRNVEVTGCDMESSGNVLLLFNSQGARITDNRFRIGRLGYAFVHGSERLIIEGNTFEGADNMARSGVFFASNVEEPVMSRVYFARNRLSNIWGHDRECISTDGASGQYFGPVTAASSDTVTLPEAQGWQPDQMAGHTLYIVGGRGKGQWRRIAGNDSTSVTVTEPFAVIPDETSVVGINHTMDRFLVVDNDFADVRIAFQFYGTAMESIVARNRAARAGGFWSHAAHYAGPPAKGAQPQFSIQYLDNHITEGQYVHAVPSGYRYGDGDSVVGVGAHPSTNPDGSPWVWPMALGFVIRGNRLDSGARIRVVASDAGAPLLEDAVVEGNHVARSDWGVDVSANCTRVLLRNNTFEEVLRPLTGDGIRHVGLRSELLASELETLSTLVHRQFGEAPPLNEARAQVEALAWAPLSDAQLEEAGRRARVTAWRELGAWRAAGYTLDILAALCGLQLEDPGWQKGTLHRTLYEGGGGEAEWPLSLTVTVGGLPVQVQVTPRWPPGWQGSQPSFTGAATPGTASSLGLQVQVPPGAWGPYWVPMTVEVSGEGCPPLSAETGMVVGAGVVLDFASIGPFPNPAGRAVDEYVHPPESRLDLGAELDGLDGKVRWETARTRGIALADRYQVTKPATAYVLTCLRATEDLRATIMVACDGGLRAWLNGRELAGFRGGPGTVTGDFRAGLNTLLLKLSTTGTGKWGLQFVNIDDTSTRPGGRLSVVPIAELPGLPELNPPSPPAADQAGLSHTGGVAWRLVDEDDFEQGSLTDRWRIGLGAWNMARGTLHGRGPRAFIALAQRIGVPLRIEYDGRSQDPCDLSAFYLEDPTDLSTGTLVGFASNNNTLNKILVEGAEVATATAPLAEPNRWHHIIVQFLPDGRVQLIVDDRLALEHTMRYPDTQPHYVGLWTWAEAEFDNVRVYGGP